MRNRFSRVVLRTSVAYWFISAVWILASDRAVLLFTHDVASLSVISMYKGWAFVTVTALLLYMALNGQFSKWEMESAMRKRAEEALGESEERYRSLFEKNKSVMLLMDPSTGNLTDANPAACTFYGYTREDFRHLHISDISPASQGSPPTEMMRSKHRLAAGELRDVEVYTGPIILQGKALLYSIVHDVTDRMAAEKALAESLDRYQTLAETIPFRTQVVDMQGTILYANGQFTTGVQDNGIGRKCWEVYKDNRQQCGICPLHQPPTTESTSVIVVDGVAGGRTFQIHHTGITYEGKSAILEVFQDITDQKEAARKIQDLNNMLARRNAELETERARWQGLVEGIADEVWTCGLDGRTNLMNPRTATPMGLEEFKDKSAAEILNEVDILDADGRVRPPADAPLLRSLKGEIIRGEEIMRHRRTGAVRHRRFSSAPTRDSNGQITGAVAIVRDITERKQAEKEIVRMNDSLSRAERLAHLGAWDIDISTAGDLDANPLHWSDEVYRIFGYEPKGITPTNELFFERVHPDDRQAVRNAVAQAISSKSSYFIEHRIVRSDGEERVVRESAEITFDQAGVPSKITGAVQDITEQKHMEGALRRQATLIDLSPDGIMCRKEDGTITFWSKGAERLYGWTSAEAIGKKSNTLLNTVVLHPSEPIAETLDRAGLWSGELVKSTRDGRTLTVESRWLRAPGTNEIMVSDVDITDRKISQRQLERSLQEKELLLKEVHHRVKNNMQIISSMLRLQSRSVTDQTTQAMLEESQHRIRSMSLIHEQLYSTDDLARIFPYDYVEKLARNLLRSYAGREMQIQVDLQIDPQLTLDLDTAIPCGLIINELVSNSLKYAFTGTSAGIISIGFRPSGPGRYTLTVSDNGKGLPQGFDHAQTQTLGLQLVHSLVSELHGKVDIATGKGTSFTITFAAPKYNKRT